MVYLILFFSSIADWEQSAHVHIKPQRDGRYGYIIKSQGLQNIQIILDALAIHNFNKEIIIASTNLHSELLEINWNKYKMINIVGVNFANMSLLRYDPFSIRKDNNRYGQLKTVNLRSHDYLTQIKYFVNNITTILHNVNGYPIKICIFEIQGQVKALRGSNKMITGYTGGNIKQISLILNASNFSQSYVFPPVGESYGTMHNGTSTGQVWVMEEGLADISANMRMIMLPNLNRSTFLYSTDDLVAVFMAPKQEDVYKMEYLGILDETVFILIALAHTLVFFMWILSDIVMRKIKNYKTRKVGYISLKVGLILFGAATSVAQPKINLLYERILLGSILLMSFVLSCIYQGTMYKFLSMGKVSADINTLNGVLNSNLEIMLTASNIPEEGYKYRDNVYDKILQKATFVTDIKGSLDKVILFSLLVFN